MSAVTLTYGGLGVGVPQGWDSDGEGSAPQGVVLCPSDEGQRVHIC